MPAAARYEQAARIRFAVEQETEDNWLLVAPAIEARSAMQAVIRAAPGTGRYRARPDGAGAIEASAEVFVVPPWGPPELEE